MTAGKDMGPAEFRAYACPGKDLALKLWSYTPRPLGVHDVEVQITHCGICYSDIHTMTSGWGPASYPVVTGHEIAGIVRAVGSEVKQLAIGQRVGVGAQVWACFESGCGACSTGSDQLCPRRVFTYEDGQPTYGGYSEAIRVADTHVFAIPDALPSEFAAPLFCAGATVFSPMRRLKMGTGHRVAVVGIGGLGHLALQFANKLGCDVVAISHSTNKKQEATHLGAKHFLNISDSEQVKQLAATCDFIIVTSNHKGQPWSTYINLLKPHGQVVLLAVPEEKLQLEASSLIMAERSMTGSLIGSVGLIRDMLEFAAKNNIRPMIEKFPVSQVNEALDHVIQGKVRYRAVLETNF